MAELMSLLSLSVNTKVDCVKSDTGPAPSRNRTSVSMLPPRSKKGGSFWSTIVMVLLAGTLVRDSSYPVTMTTLLGGLEPGSLATL